MREKDNVAASELKAALTADQLRLYGKAVEGFTAAAKKGDGHSPKPRINSSSGISEIG